MSRLLLNELPLNILIGKTVAEVKEYKNDYVAQIIFTDGTVLLYDVSEDVSALWVEKKDA